MAEVEGAERIVREFRLTADAALIIATGVLRKPRRRDRALGVDNHHSAQQP